MKQTFLAALLAVAACVGFTTPAGAQEPAPKRTFVLVDPSTGTVEERVTAVASEVAELRAEVTAMKKLLDARPTAAVGAPAPGACQCGVTCPCVLTASPAAVPKAAAAACLPGQPCYQPGTPPSATPAGATYASAACAGGSCAAPARGPGLFGGPGLFRRR